MKNSYLQRGSALPWTLVIILLISSVVGWYFYLQTKSSLVKINKQKQSIQQRYTQKSDALYESWDKLQKSNDENYQLSNQLEQSNTKTNQLNNQLEQSNTKTNQLNNQLEQSNTKTTQLTDQLEQSNIRTIQLTNQLKQQQFDTTLLETCTQEKKDEVSKFSLKLDEMQLHLDEQVKKLSVEKTQLENNDTNLVSLCRTDLEIIKKQLITKNDQLTDQKNQFVNSKSELENKQQIITTLENKIIQLSTTEDALILLNKQADDDVFKIQQQLSEKELLIEEKTKKINMLASDNKKLLSNNDVLLEEIENLKTDNKNLGNEIKKIRFGNKYLETELRRIDKLNTQEIEAFGLLNEKLKLEINAKDISIARHKDASTHIKIGNDLMFAPGQVHISKKGSQILNNIADLLKRFPNRKIEIIGHTDNIPVRLGSHKHILSNWELSAARAGAAIRYLQHGSKIDPQRMRLVGASQYQPIEEGNTDQNRAKNRRIEIRLLPENDSLTSGL